MRRLPPPRCIAVDVDGTLISERGINAALVASLHERMSEGTDVVVWSMRGRAYAESAAKRCGLDGAICISKPGLVIDDRGLDWLRECRVARP